MSVCDTHRLSYPGTSGSRAAHGGAGLRGVGDAGGVHRWLCRQVGRTHGYRAERTHGSREAGQATQPAACKSVTTSVDLALNCEAGMNPDGSVRASPLVTRSYARKSPASFELVDFFALFEQDVATLGSDLVRREERLLRPGAIQCLEWKLSPEVTVIGLFGADRDLGRAKWRQVIPIRAGQPHKLTVAFSPREILAQRR